MSELTGSFVLLERPGAGAARKYRPSRLRLDGYRGRWECELIAWTPLEAGGIADVTDPDGKSRVAGSKKQRPTRRGNRPEEFKPFHVDPVTIPGTGLKGMLRSLAEFAGSGCYRVEDRRGVGEVPRPWRGCRGEGGKVCACCDMFGEIGGRGELPALKGKVRIGDARLEGRAASWKERELSADRYPPRRRRQLPGGPVQKFFLHQEWDAKAWARRRGNASFYPVKIGARFRFSVTFEGLSGRQLALLDWCLFLQPGLLHKLGKGKALGFGSVGIRCLGQELEKMPDALRDGEKARRSWQAPGNETVLLSHAEERLPREVLAERRKLEERADLQDLRRALQWPETNPGEPIPFPRPGGGGITPPPPPPPPATVKEIKGATLEYVANIPRFRYRDGDKEFSVDGDKVREFKKSLSNSQQKKLKKTKSIVADITVREEGNKREIVEIRLPGQGKE